MSTTKVQISIKNLANAMQRLHEVLEHNKPNDILIDATIKRFEFTIELFWKTMKRMLAEDGINTNTPRETIQKAFQANWLENETVWLQMLKDRNQTSHIYDEELAAEIYRRIHDEFYPELQKALTYLQTKLN